MIFKYHCLIHSKYNRAPDHSNAMNTRTLSKTAAMALATRLNETEILSEEGRQYLIQKIETGDFERIKRSDLMTGYRPVSNECSPAQLLGLLSQAFGSEWYYRSGFFETDRLQRELQQQEGINIPTEEDYERWEKLILKKLQDFEGWRIEEAIEGEENLGEENQAFTLAPHQIPFAEKSGLIHSKRSACGKTLRRTLSDLYTIGLIDHTIFEEVSTAIKSQKLFFEFMMVAFAAERAAHYEDLPENQSKEVQFIQNLYRQQLISAEALEQLLGGRSPKQLFSKYELLPYCRQARIFRLDEYASDPATAYRQIFLDIRTIVPGFEPQDFSFELREVPTTYDPNFIEERAIIHFTAVGQRYTHAFSYNFKHTGDEAMEEENQPKVYIDNRFHLGVNKFLADQDAPYRLYYANKVEAGKTLYSDTEFGLILMTEDQFRAWGATTGSYFLSAQSHDNYFNTHQVEQIVATYEQLGLFVHLTPEEIAGGKIRVKAAQIDSYQSILACFPKTLVHFDWESGNLENPYEELTQAFGNASRAAFRPENIVDTFAESWKKETVSFAFSFNGRKYEEQLKMNRDWLDPRFMELIEKALLENQVDGKIYYCLDDGQASAYIFLNGAQYQYLQEKQESLFPG